MVLNKTGKKDLQEFLKEESQLVAVKKREKREILQKLFFYRVDLS